MTISPGHVVGLIGLLFAGLLAGEEFVIRYGVRGPLATVDDRSHPPPAGVIAFALLLTGLTFQ